LYRLLDLFAGAGGMSLGFVQTDKYEVGVAVENDQYAQATYIHNHPSAVVLADVRDIVDYDAFEQKYGTFDVIVGGPPCQGFSNANRQKNHLVSQNNGLVKKYVEIILSLQPKAFVMENVRMLRSDIHRFYDSYRDKLEIQELGINLRQDRLCLFTGTCPVSEIHEYIRNPGVLDRLLIHDKTFDVLRLMLKNSYNNDKRSGTLSKYGTRVIKLISALSERETEVPVCYKNFEETALLCFIEYAAGRMPFEEAEPEMSAFISVQRLFSAAKELSDNEIIVDCWNVEDKGVYADVHSYSVIEYISKKLGGFYLMDDDVLNAAWYGVPQVRERYIAIGIRKDLAKSNGIEPSLPNAEYKSEQFQTVYDAIKDLEDVEPSYSVDDSAINLAGRSRLETVLTAHLRNSDKLTNHIVTATRDTALKRFATLKPGQNFHDLDLRLIEDTYTRPERTQNSIYLRLDYNKPSGTVMNVRKSMWIHPTLNRAVSVREAARLQSFPDSFIFLGTKNAQYQQVGNAVPPMMAKAIANNLATLLDACIVEGVERGALTSARPLDAGEMLVCGVQD